MKKWIDDEGWEVVEMTEDELVQRLGQTAEEVRAEANRDGRWDTWGGDGVGP